MRARRRRFVPCAAAVVAIAAATAVAAAGCVTTDRADEPLPTPANEIHFYGTNGNMRNSLGEQLKDFPHGLAGMVGTAPLPPLPESFKARLKMIDPRLTDYTYAGESYDAVVISALATQMAKTTDPAIVARQINGVTTEGTSCDSPRECLAMISAGTDIAYRGMSLILGGFTDAGEPSAATYGVLRFGSDNTLDAAQTEYVPTGDASTATTSMPPTTTGSGSGPLKIGILLPRTGDLAPGGPPMFAGVKLAVQEINKAGGVLGADVELIEGDDGSDISVAQATVEKLINQDGVHIIIGAGASDISMPLLPAIVAARRILFSPCNTAAELTTANDHGLYFRTAPSDALQATALTDIIMRDGVRRIYIVARDDAYGRGLMDGVQANLIEGGLVASDIKQLTYRPDAPDFADLGADVREFAPDGVLVIGFAESAGAIDSILKAGLTSRA